LEARSSRLSGRYRPPRVGTDSFFSEVQLKLGNCYNESGNFPRRGRIVIVADETWRHSRAGCCCARTCGDVFVARLRARGAARRLLTENRRLSQINSAILCQFFMSSKRDSSGDGAPSLKRSASGATPRLCTNALCKGFEKQLGNGYCQDCCKERNVIYKPPKKRESDAAAPTNVEHSYDVQRHYASGTVVLVCAEHSCAIGKVVSSFYSEEADTYRYKVKNIADQVPFQIGAHCANKYVDHLDLHAWPASAYPLNTRVHGISRSITPSKVFESRDEWKIIQPFAKVAGVSFNAEGIPVHYAVLFDDSTKQPEMRVMLASHVVLYEVAESVPAAECDVSPSTTGLSDYQKIMSTLSADHFTQGSPARPDLGSAAAESQETADKLSERLRKRAEIERNVQAARAANADAEMSPEPAANSKITTPQKKHSPSKESVLLAQDTENAMKTFLHRAAVASSPSILDESLSLSTGSVRLEPSANAYIGEAEADDVYLQMGIDVEERWISEEIGYGIFALKEIPPNTDVTTYDGPRVDCHTGEVLFECPWTHQIEQNYTAQKKFNRSKKWGDYEREHCVLLEHSGDVCIDGTFSSQPFLFAEGFHGRTGFGASFNSGSSHFVNLKKCYKRSSRFPHDPAGITHLVRS
jgi:hypothetical protein